jgi:lipoic acid synthetase
MVGLGEKPEEVIDLMKDAYKHGVTLFTIGQYLQPTSRHLPVKEYVRPAQFLEYKKIGKTLGFDHIESGPLVRSSYHADEQVSFQKREQS